MPPKYSYELSRAYICCDGQDEQFRTSPCEDRCPAGNRIQLLHTLLAEGKVNEALHCLHSRHPFPGVTGRICPHPCEKDCNRARHGGHAGQNEHGEAVNIHALERFADERALSSHLPPVTNAPATGKRIAIVGAGPAGLTAAWFAALLGHQVEIFEQSPVIGGVPRQAVPDFRLPKDVVDRESGRILAQGVQVHTNVRVGRDVPLSALLADFDACLLAAGLWKERVLDIPGRERLLPAVAWLRRSTLDRESLEGRRVAVLGGGGVAFDCACTAARLKAAEVHLLCLENAEAMRVSAEEAEEARALGVIIHNDALVTSVRDGAVRWSEVTTFCFTDSGELQCETRAGASFSQAADMVICASGLQADVTFLNDLPGVELTPRGWVRTDAHGQSSLPGLFACGDISHGPSLVATAIGSGRRAALAIHRKLTDLAPDAGLDIWLETDGSVRQEQTPKRPAPHVVDYEEIMNTEYHEPLPREKENRACPSLLAFAETAKGFAPEQACREAGRCMHCGHCMHCGSCVEACPGHILEMGPDGPFVAYPEQCWHCGCCRIACPTGSIAYAFPLTMLL